MRQNDLFPFYAAFSALDSRGIPKTAAGDHLNVREEDGTLKFRYGYRNTSLPQSGFSAVFGLGYLQGFSGTTELEEYVTAETVSGNTRFYSRPADDGDPPTEIKNGVSSVNVDASEWVFPTFDDEAFFINPSNSSPVYRHTIGTNTSLTAIAIPADPTVAPTYVINYGPGGTTPYAEISFAGIDVATEITYSGAATATGSALQSDNSLSIRHTNSKVESSFEVDLNGSSGGVLDFTHRDRFAFSLSCETNAFNIDPGSIRVQYRNNDGTPKVLIPTEIKKGFNTSAPAGTTGPSYAVFFAYNDKTRADFDNIRYFKVTYTVTTASSTVANNDLIVSKPFIGGVRMLQPPPDRTPGSGGLYIGYSYYFSTPQFESGLSPILFIPNTVLVGTSPYAGLPELGVTVEITATVSGDSNVDNFRFYVQDNIDIVYRRLATQSDGDATYDVRLSYPEIHRLDEFQPGPFTFASVTNMFQYKGHAVWLYKGGSANVRYARSGEPLIQASDTDPIDDTAAGETFTLADGGSDEPLGGIQAGDGVMIFGKYGVYAQLGDRAVEMTPPRKISDSQGAAGKYAFTRYKDDNGVTGGAYMTPDGQVLLSIPGAFNDKEVGGTINLTDFVRDGELSPKDFLLEEQASALSLTDFSTCQVFVDGQQDALWVVMGRRAMVLRRPNIISGARYWEHYEYTTGGSTITIRYCSGAGKRRVRWIRSDGKFDEAEYNSSTRAFISGSNSDGGAAAPAGYWESKTFTGQVVQIAYVDVERDDLTDTPTVTVYSEDTPAGSSVALSSGNKGAKFFIADAGTWYRIRVTLGEAQEPIRRMVVYEIPKGRRIRG